MSLREQILAYMRQCRAQNCNVFCTWWFRFDVTPYTTKEIRRELEKMRNDGLVTSDHSQRNNTKWSLAEDYQ
jgi:hypothetical protein